METKRRDFTQAEINCVWEKAEVVDGCNPCKWRKDYAGAWISYENYGNTQSLYGWEIDHVKPLALGGTYAMNNLLPLQWNNNRTKDDNYPEWKTSYSSLNNKNIEVEQSWHIQNE